MSNREAIRFSHDATTSLRVKEQLQSHLNELLTGIADLAPQHELKVKVEELAEFIVDIVFPQDESMDDEWDQSLRGMLQRVRVQDPNHQMFKTMSVGSTDTGLSPEMQAAVEAARRRQTEET